MKNIAKKIYLVWIFIASLVISLNTFACTRVLHIDPKQGVLVGRNMDWYERMYTKLVVLPRGIAKIGSLDENPVKWISKFGSIVASSYGDAVTDGMNEKGLAMHALWLDDSDYGPRHKNIPGLSLFALVQYYLDNFQSVAEAVRSTQSESYQVLPFFHPATGKWIKLHFALEDASGDSAIIEFINGHPKVYHDPSYKVLTNEPVYNLQLENLHQYDGFGGIKKLPGTTLATDRFVRATYYNNRLPNLSTPKEAVEAVLSVLQNASPPFSFQGKNLYHRTIWRTVSDLTHQIYYFTSTAHLTTVYASLSQFDLRVNAPIMVLDLEKHQELSGDVTKQFKAYS